MHVEWDAPPGQPRPQGELLGADEQGVYLLHAGGVVLYPFGSALVLRPDVRPPEALDVEVEDEAGLQEFTKYARYPFGVGGGVLERMMIAIGVDSVIVMRRP